MSVSVSIMAHPSRGSYAKRLGERLKAPVVWDEKEDRWDTGRRALLAHVNMGSTHSLVLQDDAIIPNGDGLIPAIEKAVVRLGRLSPLVLYMTRTRQWAPRFDLIPDSVSYLMMDRIWWGVGVVFPTKLIPELVDFCDDYPDMQYDHRLGEFFYTHRIPVYYTWPNLVDHRYLPSLIPGRTSRRHAPNFVKGAADKVSWDGKIISVSPPLGVDF